MILWTPNHGRLAGRADHEGGHGMRLLPGALACACPTDTCGGWRTLPADHRKLETDHARHAEPPGTGDRRKGPTGDETTPHAEVSANSITSELAHQTNTCCTFPATRNPTAGWNSGGPGGESYNVMDVPWSRRSLSPATVPLQELWAVVSQ